jgi:hypothetical protein
MPDRIMVHDPAEPNIHVDGEVLDFILSTISSKYFI